MRSAGKYVLIFGVLLVLCGVLGVGIYFTGTPEPVGVWKDVDDDYFIVFYEDGTYVETDYNIARPFTAGEDSVILYDAAGEPYVVELKRNLGAHAVVYLNGKTHVMRASSEVPKLYTWSSGIIGNCVSAYKLKTDIGKSYNLRLYDDNVYSAVLDGTTTTGKFVRRSNGDILLLSQEGETPDVLSAWEGGLVFNELETTLEYESVNVLQGASAGMLLQGEVFDPDVGVTYRFSKDNEVSRVQLSGESTSFFYFADSGGLITMTDTAGSGVYDYLWLDQSTGSVYRYVLESDEWFEFLSGH